VNSLLRESGLCEESTDERMNPAPVEPAPRRNGTINVVQKEDLPVHGWYRFVLSYPPHLVRQYLTAFDLTGDDLVLDPFCGTGTTLVEAKRNRVPSVGCDAHPFAAMVSRVKTNWQVDLGALRETFKRILKRVEKDTAEHGLPPLGFEAMMFQEKSDPTPNGFRLTEDEQKLLPTGFLSQRPLVRLLMLRDEIERQCEDRPIAIGEFLFLTLEPTRLAA
jgi:hypothetical protein